MEMEGMSSTGGKIGRYRVLKVVHYVVHFFNSFKIFYMYTKEDFVYWSVFALQSYVLPFHDFLCFKSNFLTDPV